MATEILGFIVDTVLWITWMLLTSAKHYLPLPSHGAEDENDAYLPWSRPSCPSIPCKEEHFGRFRPFCASTRCEEEKFGRFRPSSASIRREGEHFERYRPCRPSISRKEGQFERSRVSCNAIPCREKNSKRFRAFFPSIRRNEERFEKIRPSCSSISGNEEYFVRSVEPLKLMEHSEALPSVSEINCQGKKRVRFAADVIEPSSDGKEYRRRHSRTSIEGLLESGAISDSSS